MITNNPRKWSIGFTKWFYILLLIVSIILLAFYRVHFFSGILPTNVDQTTVNVWIYKINHLQHFFPKKSQGLSILKDYQSSANYILRILYTTPVFLLITFTVGVFYFFAALFGASYQTFVMVSIGASVLTVFVLGLYPFFSINDKKKESYSIGVLILLFACFAFYPSFFSPFGKHNIATMMLVLSVLSTQWLISKIQSTPLFRMKKRVCVILLIQLLTLLSCWTNLFLLPAATVLSLVVLKEKKFIKISFYYAIMAFMFAMIVPVLSILSKQPPGASPTLLTFSSLFPNIWQRTVLFFQYSVDYYSTIGFLGGILGTFLLGIRRKEWMCFFVILSFYAVVFVILGLSAPTRLMPYILPFYIIGDAYLVIWLASLFSKNYQWVAIAGLGCVLYFSHFKTQTRILVSPAKVAQRLPYFYHHYGLCELKNNCTSYDLADATVRVMAHIPSNAMIYAGDDYLKYIILTNAKLPKMQRRFYPSLNIISWYVNKGTLESFIKGARTKLLTGRPVYVINSTKLTQMQIVGLITKFTADLGQQDKFKLELVYRVPIVYFETNDNTVASVYKLDFRNG